MNDDTSDWLEDYYRRAKLAGDRDRQQLCQIFFQAIYLYTTDPDQALAILQQGRGLAAELHEAWWILFYDYQRCDVLLYHKGDQATALDLAVRLAVEVRKPIYTNCPFQTFIYRLLIEAYLYIDPVGYAVKIRESVDYMEANMPLDQDTYRNLEWQRSALALALNQLDEAESAAQRSMARSEGEPFQVTGAYALLCEVAYRRGDIETLVEYARAAEITARRSNRHNRLLEFLCWQAYVERKRGNETVAHRLYTQAKLRAARLATKHEYFYYDALCAYHEAGGDLEHTLAARGAELANVISSGNSYEEIRCRIERCRLLKQMGSPLESETAEVRRAAEKCSRLHRF
ncbi:MAG: hypothetical protein ABI947_26930 [Chloroflexota bacterium]